MESVKGLVRDQVRSQLLVQVRDQTRLHHDALVWSKVRDEVWDKVWSPVWVQARAEV